MTQRRWALGLALAAAIGGLFTVYLCSHAYTLNGRHGFPIDDAWIHLTYARNLVEQSTFAYFPGDPTTSGSTSPLYTLLVALSIAVFGESNLTIYGLGIAFHLGFLLLVGMWAKLRLQNPWLALATVLLLGLSRHIGILAISGMETSLFLLLIALVFYAQAAKRPLLTSTALGLIIWARTDGIILLVVVAIHELLQRTWTNADNREKPRTSWWLMLMPAAGLAFGYGLFNKVIGGAWLPSTFAGKTAYYSNKPRATFLDYDLVNCFFIDAWMVLLPFVILAVGACALQILRKRPSPMAPEVGWLIALPLAYLVMLPFAGRFQRYLVPALPAFAVLGVYGLQFLAASFARRGVLPSNKAATAVITVVLLIAAIPHCGGALVARGAFAQACDYHYVRHERVGQWLDANTPPDSVIATHDIGAIAYYSRRRVIDLVGLVRPEVIEHLHTPGYTKFAEDLIQRTGVSFVATLRNWIEVDNAKPVFIADPKPEIMEIYRWQADRNHLVNPEVTAMRDHATKLLASGDAVGTLDLMRKANALDDRSARSWALTGRAAAQAKQNKFAATAYRKALALNPDNLRTRTNLAGVLRLLGQTGEADKLLRKPPK